MVAIFCVHVHITTLSTVHIVQYVSFNSRATLKVTSGATELPATAKVEKILTSRKFVGDILLRFVHTHCGEPRKGIYRTSSESDDGLQFMGEPDPASKL